MRLGILGPLSVLDDAGTELPVPAARQRILLAALLARANRIVAADELAELVWDGAPPPGAAKTVRVYLARLRQAVGPAVAGRILTQDPGYVCRVTGDELDLLHFERLCREGGDAVRSGAWRPAADLLAAALGLWRGQPFSDAPSQALCDAYVPRLEQLRLQAVEWRVEADLNLGRHEQLVPELLALAGEHPLREHIHADLMLALYRSGRPGDALAAYRSARRVLADQLGIEPQASLQRLHQQVLTGDPALEAPLALPPAPGGSNPADHADGVHDGGTVPRQLPAVVRHFTGRADELKTLSALLDRTAQDAGMVVISSIGGAAGIGKTALAVHWAQYHADRFPGGQLYINLHGFGPVGPPLEAQTVMRRFLNALGVPPARIPADLDAQTDLYRSLLAGSRVLVVLDNARDAEQVRPLLPGASGSMVLITSRDQLASLIAVEGACPLTLDLLTPAESRELLTRRLGAERLAADQQAVSELGDLCARLPLALNIAAAHAAVHPQRPLGTLVGELRDARRRLDILASRDSAADVRAVFSWSYRTLSAEAARLFRLLGVHPGPDISGPAAASLAALHPDQARRALDELTGSHLLTEHIPGRYAFHDLLRDYATEQAHRTDSEAERQIALHRVLDHYLHSAHAACALVYPDWLALALAAPHPGVTYEHPGDRDQALAWYQAEHAVLVAAIAAAVEGGFDTHTWQILTTVATFLAREGHWPEWFAASKTALAAAQRSGDLTGLAHAHRRLGNAFAEQGSYQEADAHLRQALTLYDTLGDDAQHGSTHLSLASALDRQNHPVQALAHARRALELYRNASHQEGQAWALNEIGWCHDLLGEYEQALTFCLPALGLSRELGDQYIEASTLDSIGYAYHHLGRHAEAITHYQLALRLRRVAVYRYSEANTLTHLGDTQHAVGDQAAARDAWHHALDILDDLQHPDADAIRAKLQDLAPQPSRQALVPPQPRPASTTLNHPGHGRRGGELGS